jgi:hypothetical protein
MPVIEFKEELPQSGPKFFKPATYQGRKIRIAVLDGKRKIATEIHWVEDGQGNRKPYECIHGDCCLAFGVPDQNYIIPIWVYNSAEDKAGDWWAWSLPGYKFSQFITMAEEYDLEAVDFTISFVKKGRGTDYTIVVTKTSNLTPKDRDLISNEILPEFFAFAEKAARRDMTVQSYEDLILEQGLSDSVSEMKSTREGVREKPLSFPSSQTKALKPASEDKPLQLNSRNQRPVRQTSAVVEQPSDDSPQQEVGNEAPKKEDDFDQNELNRLLKGRKPK